jgi:hypothetical protein
MNARIYSRWTMAYRVEKTVRRPDKPICLRDAEGQV